MSPKVLRIQVFIALFVRLLLEFTNADTLEQFYPVSTNCFKGIERKHEERVKQYNQIWHDECKEENMDEGFLCQKFCILRRRLMLLPTYLEDVTNYTILLDSPFTVLQAYSLLGIDESEISDEYEKSEAARVTQFVSECDASSFTVPGNEHVECRDLAPEHREKLEKLMNCLENAWKC